MNAFCSFPPLRATTQLTTLLLVAALTLSLSTLSHSLESDRLQPIQIEAQSAELDDSKGTAVYSGNVKLVQGTMIISADKLTIYQGTEGVKKAIAEGKMATYEQQLEENKPKVVASAQQINYQTKEQIMILIKDALITQGEHRFEGDRIEYDIQRQKLSATSTASQPVKMILPAGTLNGNSDEPASSASEDTLPEQPNTEESQ